MATSAINQKDLLTALDELLAKYFEERDEVNREKTSEDKFWGTYLRSMKDEDESRPKDWDGNTGSILTFTGLFAATVAAFVIESYKSLSPDSGDQTVFLLSQILAATTNSSSIPSTPTEPFNAPLPSVVANVLWFVSLVVALACALLATLVQQWSRDYVRDIKQRETLHESFTSRALNHAYIRLGVDRYGMDGVVNLLVTLVHLAVILFASGLLLFLYPINTAVSVCATFALGVFGSAYFIAGVIPIRDTSCPYRTPLTYACTVAYSLLLDMRSAISALLQLMNGDEVFRWLSRVCHPVLDFISSQQTRCSWPVVVPSRYLKLLSFPLERHVFPTRRRRVRAIWKDDMTASQFKLIWQYVSRQLLLVKGEWLKTLLESTLEILRLTSSKLRSECLAHLLSDDDVASRLDDIGRFREGSEDPELRIHAFKLVCLMIRNLYIGMDVWQSEQYQDTIDYCLFALFFMLGRIPADAGELAARSLTLQARVCLFQLRWSLLILIRDLRSTRNESQTPVLSDSHFFSKELGIDAYSNSYGDLFTVLKKNCKLLQTPESFLSLLNSWQYNPLDANRPRECHGDWTTDVSSCLIPLHNDACCRWRDGSIEHVAACTVLTTVAHLLRASEADRDDVMEYEWSQWATVWDQGLKLLCTWDDDFKMSEEDRDRTPSPEFLAILLNVGLDRWTEGGHDFSYIPPSDTPHGRLFANRSGNKLVDCLRTLTRHVNMNKASTGLPKSFYWLLGIPGSTPTTAAITTSQRIVGQSPAASCACDIPETLPLSNPKRAPGRDSFDLEQVVIDTAAVGIGSAHTSGHSPDTNDSKGTNTPSTFEAAHDANGHENVVFAETAAVLSSSSDARTPVDEGAHERGPTERDGHSPNSDSAGISSDSITESVLHASEPSAMA